MSNELTDKEAQALFNQVSKSIQNDDSEKLSSLMEQEVTEEVTPTEEVKPEDVEESTEQPADEDSKEEVTPSDEKTEEADDEKKEEVAEPDELTKLRDQLAKVSKENHALKSQAGRVPHVQRKLQELDKKLEEIAKLKASPSSQPSAKIKPKIDELLKGVKSTDPELADAIAAAIAEATDGLASDSITNEEKVLQIIRDNEYQTHQDQEATRLLEMYPNAPEVFASSSWAEWKSTQSKRMQGLATSDSADDVATAFELYARDMVAKHPELAETKAAKEETPAVKSAEALKAEQIEAERKRKKESSANVSNPSAPGKVGMPDDPEALFKKFSEQIRKDITG